MDTDRYWISTNTQVFRDHFDEDDPDAKEWMQGVGIHKIEWMTNAGYVCKYCGNEWIGEAQCPGCGRHVSRSEYFLGVAIVTFHTTFPQAMGMIFHPNWKSNYYILHKECGYRAFFDPYEVIMMLDFRKVVGRRMSDVVSLSPDDAALVSLYVDMECEVELYPDHNYGQEESRQGCSV